MKCRSETSTLQHSPAAPLFHSPPQVPLSLAMESDDTFLFNLRLPDPAQALNSIAYKVRYILDKLSLAAFGRTTQEAELLPEVGGWVVRQS